MNISKIIRFVSCAIIAFQLISSVFATPQYDERGNLISKVEPEKKTDLRYDKKPVDVVKLPDLPEKNKEEASTKVNLEMAMMYLKSNRSNEAKDFLKKAIEAGDDDFSRRARLLYLYLRAENGELNLESEIDAFPEQTKPSAMNAIADGWEKCYREKGSRKICRDAAERLFSLIAKRYPSREEGKSGMLKAGILLAEKEYFEAALPLLLQGLKENLSATNAPLDQAWYQLGVIYEKSAEHRDYSRACIAFGKVLTFRDSVYIETAKQKMQHLNNNYIGRLRP